MKEKKEILSRREFFKGAFLAVGNGIKETASILYGDGGDVFLDEPELIRPPGAIEESEFLEKCTRCNECVKVCPKEAIRKFIGEDSSNHLTPMLHLRTVPCVLCEDFPCARVCKTNALVKPESQREVKMGIAVINTKICVAWQGGDCNYCIKECPLSEKAIQMDEQRRPVIVKEKCMGCGLCEYICPARQSAIVVRK